MSAFDKLSYIYNFVKPFLDIAIMTYLLYKAYDFMSKTNSVQILKTVVIVAIAYAIAVILDLKTLLWVLNIIAPGLVISLTIIFQPEIRKLFLRIGQSKWFAFGSRSKHTYVDSVLIAAETLSKQKRGMLAVFLRHTKLDNILQSGTRLNADVSSALLVTIFGMDTPLHDGACFIQGGKLVSAGCFLPLSEV
ncbi:MAG: diadenylate cyclase [Treponema sp.]|nr:diadenylate cyclase [Candidatus Treponema merdequi]MCQ2088508.1 diadenylate cyclase [Bacilli bacterium]